LKHFKIKTPKAGNTRPLTIAHGRAAVLCSVVLMIGSALLAADRAHSNAILIGRSVQRSSAAFAGVQGAVSPRLDRSHTKLSSQPQADRLRLAPSGGPVSLSWTAKQGARSGKAAPASSERSLIERLALGSPDQFILAQLRGAPSERANQIADKEKTYQQNNPGSEADRVNKGAGTRITERLTTAKPMVKTGSSRMSSGPVPLGWEGKGAGETLVLISLQ
jgi:hypothetical protein